MARASASDRGRGARPAQGRQGAAGARNTGTPARAATLRARLLRWYDRHARDLPWRRTRDPYAIWVSEVMLQQTRVDTVLGYYERFLDRFPDPGALASASEDEVMAAWSGLGYYRRARLLHRGVREVVARYGGRVPEDPQARRALPGVGRYTAGAIGSIAFSLREPLVDGNVARVLSRIHGVDTPRGRADTERRLWTHAAALVEGPRPGDLNQALMELGATLCRKQRPACAACPVRADCRAHVEHRTEQLPVPRPRAAPLRVRQIALVATRGRPGDGTLRLWLTRGEGSLFGGLWNLPMAAGRGRAAARDLLAAHGLQARLAPEPAGRLEHVLSHRRMDLELWRATGTRGSPGQALAEVSLQALDRLGTSSLTRRALRATGL